MRRLVRSVTPAPLRDGGRRIWRSWNLRRAARSGGALAVYYGQNRIPGSDAPVSGGIVKFQRLQHAFPNSPRRFNLLYLGSNDFLGSNHRIDDFMSLLDVARRKGVKIVLNQDGVAYPGWYGPGWKEANRPMAAALHAADHVFFQSRFCEASAERFLGRRQGPSEVLYNAVDTSVFVPGADPPRDEVRLLLSGTQYQGYPVETAVRTLAELVRQGVDTRLLITGQLTWTGDPGTARGKLAGWTRDAAVEGRVELLGPYTQREAPTVHHRAHVLLHPKYNDPCPSGVIEAMSCGLPVAYSASGGVPELVGEEAGLPVAVPHGWQEMAAPDPSELARAVLTILERWSAYAEAARQRAVERFDLAPWIQRHRQVFTRLVGGEAGG